MAKQKKDPQPITAPQSEPTAPDTPTEARQKFGGRQKGAQNRVTRMTKEVITSLLTDYQESGLMTEDFCALEPKDRITIAEKMMQYVMPKMQATAVDLQAKDPSATSLEERLRALSKPPE